MTSGTVTNRRSYRAYEPLWVLALTVSLACAPEATTPPPTNLRIATSGEDGVYYALGTTLARIYSERIPNVVATTQTTRGSLFNVQSIQLGTSEVAFAVGGVVFRAHVRGTERYGVPHTKLRGIAVLSVNAVQIFVRRDSEIRDPLGLQGKNVAFVARAVGKLRGLGVEAIIDGLELDRADIVPEFLTSREVTSDLGSGILDAGIFMTGFPISAVVEAASTSGLRLLPFKRERAHRFRRDYPFFRPIIIPRGVYPEQNEEVQTLGLDTVLVCRDDLSVELVYQLTKLLFQSLEELTERHYAARLIDPDQGPTTPIPLHPGAAQYYRERELLRW